MNIWMIFLRKKAPKRSLGATWGFRFNASWGQKVPEL